MRSNHRGHDNLLAFLNSTLEHDSLPTTPFRDPTTTQTPESYGDTMAPSHDDIRDLEDLGLSNSREWNAQPAICKLPGEILSLVFQAACPPAVFGAENGKLQARVGHSLVHIVLSQVCTYWRGVVQATPQLWTHLTLYLNLFKFDLAVSLLLQFLERSGDLPLTLSFHFSSDLEIPIDNLLREDVDALLLKNFLRIQGLELSSPPTGWLSPTLPPLRQLLTLSLGYSRRLQPLILFTYPGLRHLYLTRVFATILPQPPCQTITTLHLSTVPIDVCATVLSQCPQLVDFENHRPYYAWDRDASLWPTERTSFLEMKVFDWEILSSEGNDITWQSALLNNINLPSLQSLRWSHPRWLRRPFPYEHTACRFFSTLPATLTKLTLCGIQISQASDDYSEVVARIRSDANVEQIIFVSCDAEFIQSVVQSLVPQSGVQLRFPNLRDITIEKFFWPQSVPSAVEYAQETLISMLEHRMPTLGGSFSIHLERSPDFQWLSSSWRSLTDLKHRGFPLAIFEDSKPVPWLT